MDKILIIKELTIQEKAEAYDRALEVLHKYDGANIMFSQSLKEEMFPELRELDDEKIRKALLNEFIHLQSKGCKFAGLEGEDIIAWLNRQGDQKLTNKIVFKFHKDDWCIDNEDGTVFQIVKILDNTYTYKTIEGKEYSCTHYSLENDARLWNIKDVKPGDVLVDKDNNIGIFQECEGIYWNSYIYLGCDGKLRGFSIGGSHVQNGTYPATKEQRDTLMKAMTEAECEFDFNKKELKKIEHKSFCELDNSYSHVTFPFMAKVKSTGKIVTIHGGQLNQGGGEWIKYQSDVEDGYKVYKPNDLELVRD